MLTEAVVAVVEGGAGDGGGSARSNVALAVAAKGKCARSRWW